jgi:hypothetical protein
LGSTHAGELLYALYLQNIQDEQNQPTKPLLNMKKGLLKKGLLILAITAAIALTASKDLFARGEIDDGCAVTWNSSSFCFSNSGVPIWGCGPGPTWCIN